MYYAFLVLVSNISTIDIYQKMRYNVNDWYVVVTRRALKQIGQLPSLIKASTLLLMRDIKCNGPGTSGRWKNCGKFRGMRGDRYHCHVSKGRPTYVCCWQVINKKIRIVEVYYVGTYEKAPY